MLGFFPFIGECSGISGDLPRLVAMKGRVQGKWNCEWKSAAEYFCRENVDKMVTWF